MTTVFFNMVKVFYSYGRNIEVITAVLIIFIEKKESTI